MKRKKLPLSIKPLIGLGQIVCDDMLCDECPQKENCKPWLIQPVVNRKLAEWYLGKLGYFKVAK